MPLRSLSQCRKGFFLACVLGVSSVPSTLSIVLVQQQARWPHVGGAVGHLKGVVAGVSRRRVASLHSANADNYTLSAGKDTPCEIPIESKEECKEAAKAMGLKWDGTRRWTDRLPGCLKTNADDDVNFNLLGGKGENDDQTPLCYSPDGTSPTPTPTVEDQTASTTSGGTATPSPTADLSTNSTLCGGNYRMVQIKDAPAYCLKVADKGEESGDLSVVKVRRIEVWACDPHSVEFCFHWNEDDSKIYPYVQPTKCVSPRVESAGKSGGTHGSGVGVHPCNVSRSWKWWKTKNGTDIDSESEAASGGMIQTDNPERQNDCAAVHGLYGGAKVELAPCNLTRSVELQFLSADALADELDAAHASDASKTEYENQSATLGKAVNQELRDEFGPDGVPEEAQHWDEA